MRSGSIILFFLFVCYASHATDRTAIVIDSLETVLSKTSDDNERFKIYESLFKTASNVQHKKAEVYLEKIEALDKKINTPLSNVKRELFEAEILIASDDNEAIVTKLNAVIPKLRKLNLNDDLKEVYNLIGRSHTELGNYTQGIEFFAKSDSICREIPDIKLQCENAMYTGKCYEEMGNDTKAIEYVQKSLALCDRLNNKKLRAQALLILGSVYSEGSNQEYSLGYLDQAGQIAVEEKDTAMLMNVNTYKANIYYYQKQYRKALNIYEYIKHFCSPANNKRAYAGILGNMGNVYSDMGEDQKGMELQLEAAKLYEELQDKEGVTICYSSIGISNYNLKNYQKALEYYQKALVLAEEMKTPEDLIEIHMGLANTYEALGDYKKAYENFKEYNKYSDSTFNSDKTKKITELELNYQFENKQKEVALERALEEERFKRWIYLAICGIALLLIILTIIFRNNRQRKKTNEQLQTSNTEISKQKEELQQKSMIIEMAYNDIKSSINYAKRIQEAILPVKDEIKRSFAESFVLFKPRDIVSGDFYWFEKHNNINVIACVDCTGHGVPGAFMSMIGNTLLNEIVNEKGIEKPSDILNLLHTRVRQSLKQDLENNETRDGMDIAICTVDTTTNILQYAGANRPLCIIRNGRVNEIKPDKMAIGGDQMGEDRSFTNHKIDLQKNDMIYLSSDGYADQFGGEKGKKFMVKRFHQTLLEINNLSMERQGVDLKKIIERWQGDIEQIDDILVIGIKIN